MRLESIPAESDHTPRPSYFRHATAFLPESSCFATIAISEKKSSWVSLKKTTVTIVKSTTWCLMALPPLLLMSFNSTESKVPRHLDYQTTYMHDTLMTPTGILILMRPRAATPRISEYVRSPEVVFWRNLEPVTTEECCCRVRSCRQV